MKMVFSTRKALCLIAFLFLFLSSECKGEDPYKPAPTCATYECAEYIVVHTQKEFEIRSYNQARWLSGPKLTSNSYNIAATKGFFILQNYLKGNNTAHATIKMTAPALVDVRNSTYTMYIYVEKKYQNNVPPPVSRDILPVKFPTHKYAAVRRFGGFLTDDVIPKEIAELKKSLQGTPYRGAAALDLSTVAAYSDPFSIIDRVNEVFLWFD